MGSDLSLQIIDNIFKKELNEHKETLKTLESLSERIYYIHKTITEVFNANKKLLICGNGGSAADAAHITGELLGKFIYERKPLNAICLNSEFAAITAISNDDDYSQIFARQVKAYSRPGAIVFGISTSGNSKNVINALNYSKKNNITTCIISGNNEIELENLDFVIKVPSKDTATIQTVTQVIYHSICDVLESQ